jgi:hypothetical protein
VRGVRGVMDRERCVNILNELLEFELITRAQVLRILWRRDQKDKLRSKGGVDSDS